MAFTVTLNIPQDKGGAQSLVAVDKLFSTGSTGFNVSGKVVIDGATYQVGCNIVKVGSGGSKPKSKK